jgi:hypothetical protein
MERLNKNIGYPENIILEILSGNDGKPVTKDMIDGYYHVLGSLSDKQQDMLHARFCERKTYKQMAKEYVLSDYKTTDIIRRSIRSLRKPQYVRYVFFGLDYLTRIQTEENQRTARIEDAAKNPKRVLILLEEMEEISARTYIALWKHSEFRTLSEVAQFVKIKGEDWYKEIPGLTIKGKTELEQAIELYNQK